MGGGKKAGNKSKTKNLKAVDEKKGRETAVQGVREEASAAGKTAAGKKTGGKTKPRNPNLKLVKNNDAPVKKDSLEAAPKTASGKKTSQKKVSAKKAASKENTAEESASKKKVSKENITEEPASKKKTPEESISKQTHPKSSPSEETSQKEPSKKESSKKKPSKEEPSQKKTSQKKSSQKKTSKEKSSQKKISPEKPSQKKASPEKPSQKKSSPKNTSLKEFSPGRISSEKTFSREGAVKKNFGKEVSMEYDDRSYAAGGWGIGEWFIQHKSLVIIWLTVFAVVGALAFACYYVVTNYRVSTVYVDGNVHYTNEEIMDMVMTGVYGNNSLYLAMKYKDKGVEGVPFVERMDVDILTPNTIRIRVYEKALAGYVEYLGRYMYFDRDGIIVESSKEKTEGIPQVTGLKFNYVVLNEALPVENDGIFRRILSITQLLDKYELTADKIYFDSDYDLTLFFEGVRVTLGSSEEIDEKIMRLQYILPELSGKKGTLSMENYTEDARLIPFHQD